MSLEKLLRLASLIVGDRYDGLFGDAFILIREKRSLRRAVW
ncbi:hypothetical protein [Nostoc sp. JL33]|nr:hypothetical protein [Nostoc sp. JL33]